MCHDLKRFEKNKQIHVLHFISFWQIIDIRIMKGLVPKETVVSYQQGGETPKIGMKQDVDKAHITIVKISQGWCFKSSPFKRQRAST